MKKLIVVLLLFVAVSANAQWVQQYSGTNYHLLDICFPSAGTGWIVSDSSYSGKLLKTTNGGTNWTSQNYGSTKGLWGIYFINPNTGWIVGNNGVVRNTTNAGQNWNAQYIDSTKYFNQVYFLNSTTGWIAGNNLYKTTNAGINWVKNISLTACWAVYFQNESTGFVTTYQSKVNRTTNGGSSWDVVYTGDFHTHLKDICFINANTGWIAGEDDLSGIIKTTNAGVNWASVIHNTFNAVYFKDANTGWAAGYAMYKTTNSGVNWFVQNLPPTYQNINSMTFINDSTGFAVGNDGKIFKTMNGGVSVTNISTEIPSAYSLGQNYPNPFNPTTTIKFTIPQVSSPHGFGGDLVLLKIFDVSGREVETLVNEQLQPGTFSTQWNASTYSSGVYFYKITAGDFSETKRMLLVK